MIKLLRNRHFYYMLILDAALVAASYIGAYLLRYEGDLPRYEWVRIRDVLPFILVVKLSCFYLFGLYRGMWRYTSIDDLVSVIKAALVSSFVMVAAILYLFRFEGYSRAAFVMDWLLTVLLIGGVRFGVRLVLTNNVGSIWRTVRKDPRDKRLLIIGAGAAAEKAIREVLENPGLRMRLVGLLDDDPAKQGKTIHGIPIMGTVEDIVHLDDDYDEILIAIPSAKGNQMRRIVDICEQTGRVFRTMPSIGELIDGKVSLRTVREVRIEDILGREEVRLEKKIIDATYRGKGILITGAGGSIGSELVRQVCRFSPAEVGLLDFSEFNLFSIESMCREDFSHVPIRTYLSDIRDRNALVRVFQEFQPAVVFHAAAYKHVPIQEMHPGEAVRNNVLGTMNMADIALSAEVELFVLVSTDKAVRPANVMGATKRVAEIYCQSRNGAGLTRFVAVRFGNVLGSSGSVVPIFQAQISKRMPVTVTHPEVTRYFMSIPEAAQLILQAGAMGRGGEIFILDMGRQVRIADLARDLIRLHGLEPEKDIPLVYVGLRPGEKLYEELITIGEDTVRTEHEKIFVIHGCSFRKDELESRIAELMKAVDGSDGEAIKRKLQEIVPEYTPYGQAVFS